MSHFKETDEFDPANMVKTDYGFALKQERMPSRHDVFWLKMPEESIYVWEGDGWLRLRPPEPKLYPAKDLPHD